VCERERECVYECVRECMYVYKQTDVVASSDDETRVNIDAVSFASERFTSSSLSLSIWKLGLNAYTNSPAF